MRDTKATLVEIDRRVVEVKSSDKNRMYINGADNLYPNRVEGIINNSPTAFRCTNLMAKYIKGKGIVDENGELIPYKLQTIVNETKNYRISDVVSLASKSIAYQYGVFFHVIYGIDEDGAINPVGLDVLNYSKCRKSKEDDDEYPGMIIYKDFEKGNTFGKKEKERKFYPFNSNKDVILAQILNDAGIKGGEEYDLFEAIKHYRGQVFYLNLNPDQVYSSSLVDSVYNDADTEYRIGSYINSQSRIGFLGKTIFLTQGLDEQASLEVKDQLAEFMGAEASANAYHIDVEQSDDISKILHTIQLDAQFDDKLFSETKKTIRENILGAFNNVVSFLILANDTMFGTQAETYKEGKIFYSEQNEYEREQLERAFDFMGFPIKIEPIAKRENAEINAV